eukprot:GHRR01022482.1.p1 GENE.GHRR01022482.1~~GHRR01022482.1.p1  ORF type:complete len:278 (+),score=76.22 GHRR01022482.1:828-1661(+)
MAPGNAFGAGWGGLGAHWNQTGRRQHGYEGSEDRAPMIGTAVAGAHEAGTGPISKVAISIDTGAPELAAREAAIVQREAALLAKERELRNREAELRQNGLGPRKNWPVCFPLIHHDIAADIPPGSQPMVRMAYYCYLGLIVSLLYNLFGACAMVGFRAPDKMSSWFLAIIYCIAGIPLAMVFWYNKLYNVAASNGALGYLGFFIGFAIHTAFSAWAAIAVPLAGERWSFTGFVAALRAFDVGTAAGVIYLIGSCLWSIEALASLWCLKMVGLLPGMQ